MVRINKFLASCNLGSRREVEKYVINGKISINGQICHDLASQIDPDKDTVKFLNKIIKPTTEKIYILLNKPTNYIVSLKDELARKTVSELLPDLDIHLFPVGRLDYKSEGLLIFTNDGYFANSIIHPRYKLPKVYRVKINKNLTQEELKRLRNGLFIDGKKTLPAKVFIKKSHPGAEELRITLFEGRNRQIRKMLKSVSAEVLKLRRLQIGNLKLGDLPRGMWRFLNDYEVDELLKMAKTKRGKE